MLQFFPTKAITAAIPGLHAQLLGVVSKIGGKVRMA
jgi:hypothetical protein